MTKVTRAHVPMPAQAEREYREEEDRRTHDWPPGTGFLIAFVVVAILYGGIYFGCFSS